MMVTYSLINSLTYEPIMHPIMINNLLISKQVRLSYLINAKKVAEKKEEDTITLLSVLVKKNVMRKL
jgi:hypothetical protein